MTLDKKLSERIYRSMRVPLKLTPLVAMLFVADGCKPKQPMPMYLELETTNSQTVAGNYTDSDRINATQNQNSTNQVAGYSAQSVISTNQTGTVGGYSPYRPSGASSFAQSGNSSKESSSDSSKSYQPSRSEPVNKPTPASPSKSSITRGGFGGTGHAAGGSSS